jgi:hypothetical protein
MVDQTPSATEKHAFESWWGTGQWPTDVAPSAWAHRESAWSAWSARATLAQQQSAWLTKEDLDALSDYIYEALGRPSDWGGFDYDGARAALSRAAPSVPVVAWVRFCSDGGVEAPIMDWDRRMDDARRKSGAWTPLGVIAAPQPNAQQADCKCRRLGDWDGAHHPLCDSAAEQPASLQAESVKENAESLQKGGEARGVVASILGPDEDGIPIARYSHRSTGMLPHPNGTWVRYGEVEQRAALLAASAAALAMTCPNQDRSDCAMFGAAPAAAEAQAPVAWKWRRHKVDQWQSEGHWDASAAGYAADLERKGFEVVRLYDAPQPAQSRQAQGGALSDEDIEREWDRAWKEVKPPIGIRKVVCATVRACLNRAASEPRTEGLEGYSYQQLFDAIAFATCSPIAGQVAISVADFRAFLAAQ